MHLPSAQQLPIERSFICLTVLASRFLRYKRKIAVNQRPRGIRIRTYYLRVFVHVRGGIVDFSVDDHITIIFSSVLGHFNGGEYFRHTGRLVNFVT